MMGEISILVVMDDRRLDADVLRAAADADLVIDAVSSADEAVSRVTSGRYAAIFLDRRLLTADAVRSLASDHLASTTPTPQPDSAPEGPHDWRKLLDSVANNTEACLAFLDRDLNFTWVNDAYAERSGYPREFLLGRNHFALFPQGMSQVIVDQVMLTGEPCLVSEKLTAHPGRPGSRTTYWDWTLSPIHNESRELQGFVLSHIDITDEVSTHREVERLRAIEHRQREELEAKNLLLDAERRRLQAILHHMPAGVFMVEASSSNAVFANERAAIILRDGPGQPSESGHQGIHPDGRFFADDEWPVWRSVHHGETVVDEEITVLRGDGAEGVLRVSSTPIHDSEGAIVAGVVMFTDITARRQAEVALRESEERLRLALDAAHMVGWSWNPETDEITETSNETEILGTSVTTGAEFGTLVHPRDFMRIRVSINNALASGGQFSTEFRITRPDTGEMRWVEMRGRVLCDSCGRAVRIVGVQTDITERKQADQTQEVRLSQARAMLDVSADVLAEITIEGLLRHTADAARALTEAGISVCANGFHPGAAPNAVTSVSSDIPWTTDDAARSIERGGVYTEIINEGRSIRYTDEELRSHPGWWGLPDGHPALRGLIGAPLIDRTGRTVGLVMASDKRCGEFTEEDEALLNQLALIASLGLQHIEARREAEHRAEEAEDGRRLLDALMEHVPDGISIVGASDYGTRRASRYSADLVRSRFGDVVTPEDMWHRLAIFHSDGVTPMDMESHPLVRAVRRGEVVTNEEIVIRGQSGAAITALCNAAPIKDQCGNVTSGVMAWRDISTLKAAQEVLETALERERHIAEVLQESLIPKVDMDLPGYRIAARYQPALHEAEVGGDFYDVFPIEGGRLGIIMGDISGKGLQAAVHTAMVKHFVMAYALEDPSPDSVVTKLNRAMYTHTRDELFVTVFYGVLDPTSDTLVYANGGHDEPLLYIDCYGYAVPMDVTGRAVGMMPHSTYGQRIQKFRSGDLLLIYTDGITDARNCGRFYGVEGLRRTLVEYSDREVRTMIDAVFDAVSSFADGDLRDDAAVLVVKMK